MFIGKRWRRRLFVLLLLVLVWNKEKAFKWFQTPKLTGGINIGVLVDDKDLPGNKDENIALAKEYLSENYHWVYIPDQFNGKIPLPWPPFTESTGFHFQPFSKKQQEVPLLLADKQ